MDQDLTSTLGHQFLVGINGIQLPSEAVDRINRAIQKAVLIELASVDLGAGFNVLLSAPVGNGGTDGLTIEPRR